MPSSLLFWIHVLLQSFPLIPFHRDGVRANYFCIPARRLCPPAKEETAEEKLQRQTSPQGRVRSGLGGDVEWWKKKVSRNWSSSRLEIDSVRSGNASDMQTSSLWSNCGKKDLAASTREWKKWEFKSEKDWIFIVIARNSTLNCLTDSDYFFISSSLKIT